jgi:iron complex outermembrane recepter protein
MKITTTIHPLSACVKAAVTGGTLMLLAGSPLAFAQDAAAGQKAEQDVEKIVVVGSRGAPRSVGDSAVPVDVISAD